MTAFLVWCIAVGIAVACFESYRCGRNRGWLEGGIDANGRATERLRAHWEAGHVGPKPESRLVDEPNPKCDWCGRPTAHTYIRHLTFVHACDEEHADMSFGRIRGDP